MSTTAIAAAHPNPSRAHGAWVYLFASVVAGAVIGAEQGIEPCMLVATGFVGAFLLVSSVTAGARRKGRQILTGASLAAMCPLAALWLDADPGFLIVAGLAAVAAAAAIGLERTLGFLSRAALIAGIASLALAAPVVAVAGGASPEQSALLFGLLWPFFCWRTLDVARPLQAGAVWDRAQLRSRGLQEAAIAGVWTLLVTLSLCMF